MGVGRRFTEEETERVQRAPGSAENTIGLPHQHLPRRTDSSVNNQRELDAIAKSLNTPPP